MTTLREALKNKLTKKEQQHLRTSFDVIGDIAIIEVPRELKKREKLIAKTLLNLLNNINVVAVKTGGHKGKYRRQGLKILAGEKRFETQHTESGVRIKLNVEQCYFSPRLVTERLRIAKQVKKGETILVAGSGVAPYPLVLSKHTQAKEIVGVEANPIAHKYAVQNVTLNKLSNITLIKGDITKIKLRKFDRIISVIPHKGVTLAPALLTFAKKGTRLHIMDFAPETEIKHAGKKLKQYCDCRILRVVKAGQHAVRQYRITIDAKV